MRSWILPLLASAFLAACDDGPITPVGPPQAGPTTNPLRGLSPLAPYDPAVNPGGRADSGGDFPSVAQERPRGTPSGGPPDVGGQSRRVTPRPGDESLSLAQVKARVDAARAAMLESLQDSRTPQSIKDAAYQDFEYWNAYYNQRLAAARGSRGW